MLTEQDLREINARARKATKGPWIIRYGGITTLGDHFQEPIRCGDDCVKPDDAEFIAHARQDVPVLVAEVRRLRRAAAASSRAAEDRARYLAGRH